MKPPSREGTHASSIVAKAAHARRAPNGQDLRALGALPYSFVTMWLAATGAGLTRENAKGKRVLVNGAAGGLGTLALQTLSEWGAQVTAIAKASAFDACLAAGAVEAVDRTGSPSANSQASSTRPSTSPFGTTKRRSYPASARARSVMRRPFIPWCRTSMSTAGSAAPGARCSTRKRERPPAQGSPALRLGSVPAR